MLKNISKIVLYVLCAVTAVIACLFFFGGYVDANAEYPEPIFTNALIILMYVLVVLAAVLVIGAQLWQFIKRLQSEPKQALKSVIGIGVLAVLLIITYFCSAGEPMALLGSDDIVSGGTVKLVDMQIYSIYVLVVIGLVLMAFGGFAKKIK